MDMGMCMMCMRVRACTWTPELMFMYHASGQ